MKNGYSILHGAKYFSKDDGSQNYLVFQPAFKNFKVIPMISDVTLNLLLHHIIVLIQDWITLVILYFKENLLKLASAC